METKRILQSSVLAMAALLVSPLAGATLIGGIEFPAGATSFADSVVSYVPGSGASAPFDDPTNALGIPNYPSGDPGDGHVSLGIHGVLVLRFVDNSLTTSGDSNDDLWIFEVGAQVEATAIDISTNGTDWISVGSVGGATAGIDIDAYIGAGVTLWQQYSFVRLTNLETLSGSPYAGADIDAVGAISSAPPVPEPASMALLGMGLIGLAARRKRQS